MSEKEPFILVHIHGFWNDSHSEPAQVIAITDSVEEAVVLASTHWANQHDLRPGEALLVWERSRDSMGVTLSKPDDGQMAYRIERPWGVL